MAVSVRTDIQGLRGLGIALIVLLHAGLPGFQGGFVGVEVFFVISGYVVTASLLRKPAPQPIQNLRNFFVKRILRLMPASTLVIIATVVAAYFLLGPAFNPDLFDDARWATVFGTNFRLIDTGANYFIAGLDKSLLTHYWYLAIEQQVYLVYPLVIFIALAVLPERWRRGLPVALLLLVTVASGWFSWQLTQTDSVAAYFSPVSRVWELTFGATLAFAPDRWFATTRRLNTVISVLALAGLLAASFLLGPQSPYPGVLAWWPAACTAVLILALPNSSDFGPKGWLSLRPLAYLGDISYSLYLWHYAWLLIPAQMISPLSSPAWVALELVGALGCAVITHRYIEVPIRNSKTLSIDGFSTFLVLAVCVGLALDAVLIVQNLWLANRG